MQSFAFGLLQHLCDPDKHAITATAGAAIPWSEKLAAWRRGVPQTYPPHRRLPFLYETSGFADPCAAVYKEEFVECAWLLPRRADAGPFMEHIVRSVDRWATAFDNMSGDTRLVIPMPRQGDGMQFATMKDFVDAASFEHQQHFWRRVALEVERWMQTRSRGGNGSSREEKVYISTHGHGVAYFHVRICAAPKYYCSRHLM
jgi:hypothetical protein